MSESEWTKILRWPGYRVYRSEINEQDKTLRLWVRRKRGNRKLECSGCGRKIQEIAEVYEREVRDLPWSEYRTALVIELYRVRCPDCGIKVEKVPLLPSKAPFCQRFEDAVGQACESAALRRAARQFGLAASTVRAIDLRYLRRWAQSRRRPALRQMGVDDLPGEETEVSHRGDQPYSDPERQILRARFPQQSPRCAAVKISVSELRMKFSAGSLQCTASRHPAVTSRPTKHKMLFSRVSSSGMRFVSRTNTQMTSRPGARLSIRISQETKLPAWRLWLRNSRLPPKKEG
jgi:hypothetical protein